MRFLQTFFNLSLGGFGFPSILIISPGDMALFFVIIIGHPRNLFNFILGFMGGKGFGCLIIPSKITVSFGIILRWLVGCSAPLYVTAL